MSPTPQCELPVNPAAAAAAHTAYDWGLAEAALAEANGSVDEWEQRIVSEDLAGFAAMTPRFAATVLCFAASALSLCRQLCRQLCRCIATQMN